MVATLPLGSRYSARTGRSVERADHVADGRIDRARAARRQVERDEASFEVRRGVDLVVARVLEAEHVVERRAAAQAVGRIEAHRLLRPRSQEPEDAAQAEKVLPALLRAEEADERPRLALAPDLDLERRLVAGGETHAAAEGLGGEGADVASAEELLGRQGQIGGTDGDGKHHGNGDRAAAGQDDGGAIALDMAERIHDAQAHRAQRGEDGGHGQHQHHQAHDGHEVAGVDGELQREPGGRAGRRRHLDAGGVDRQATSTAATASPTSAPITPSHSASSTTMSATCPRPVPMASRVPNSRTRSITDMSSVFDVARQTSTNTIPPRNQKMPE